MNWLWPRPAEGNWVLQEEEVTKTRKESEILCLSFTGGQARADRPFLPPTASGGLRPTASFLLVIPGRGRWRRERGSQQPGPEPGLLGWVLAWQRHGWAQAGCSTAKQLSTLASVSPRERLQSGCYADKQDSADKPREVAGRGWGKVEALSSSWQELGLEEGGLWLDSTSAGSPWGAVGLRDVGNRRGTAWMQAAGGAGVGSGQGWVVG